MLTIFNRKELIVTMDIHRQAEIRDVLAQNGINYTVKTKICRILVSLTAKEVIQVIWGLIKVIHMNIKSMYIKKTMRLHGN